MTKINKVRFSIGFTQEEKDELENYQAITEEGDKLTLTLTQKLRKAAQHWMQWQDRLKEQLEIDTMSTRTPEEQALWEADVYINNVMKERYRELERRKIQD